MMRRSMFVFTFLALGLTSACSADAEWNKNYTYLKFTPTEMDND